MIKESYYKYISAGLIIIVLLIATIRTDYNETIIQELELKIKNLSSINAQLKTANETIEASLELKKDSILMLESEVAEIEYKKILLRNYYENKISNIDKLNVSQLDSMFSTRYSR